MAFWHKWLRTALIAMIGWGNVIETEVAAEEPADWLYRAWQTDDGLPDNNFTGVLQTEDGFLWVATLGGLMRFDGIRFDEFSLAARTLLSAGGP